MPSQHITQHFQDGDEESKYNDRSSSENSALLSYLRLLAILGKSISVLPLEIRVVMHVTYRADVLTEMWFHSSSRRNLVKSLTKCGIYRPFKPAIKNLKHLSCRLLCEQL